MKHIPNREFSDAFKMIERWGVIEKYSDPCWDGAKSYLSETRQITKSAVRIAEVMRGKLNIDLFPMIKKIACKGWDVRGGTFAFLMIDKNGEDVCFESKARYYKSMKRDYGFYYNDITHTESIICI